MAKRDIGFIENFQVDEYVQQPLFGVDVIFQNYSLMENDKGYHQIMP
jgi:hypothetical protein